MAMMDIINVVWLGAGGWALIGLIAYLFYGPFQQASVDECRQRLFEARDAIFLVAHRDGLDDECHRRIREELNMFIRYAHKLTLPRMLITLYFLRRRPGSREPTMWEYANRIETPDVRKVVNEQLASVARALAVLLAERSLIMQSAALLAQMKRVVQKYLGIQGDDVLVASSSIAHDAFQEETELHDRLTKDACRV